jgi:hypothetical protein
MTPTPHITSEEVPLSNPYFCGGKISAYKLTGRLQHSNHSTSALQSSYLKITKYWEAEIKVLWFQGWGAKSWQDLISNNKPSVVVQACNPSYLEGGGRRIMVLGQP